MLNLPKSVVISPPLPPPVTLSLDVYMWGDNRYGEVCTTNARARADRQTDRHTHTHARAHTHTHTHTLTHARTHTQEMSTCGATTDAVKCALACAHEIVRFCAHECSRVPWMDPWMYVRIPCVRTYPVRIYFSYASTYVRMYICTHAHTYENTCVSCTYVRIT